MNQHRYDLICIEIDDLRRLTAFVRDHMQVVIIDN